MLEKFYKFLKNLHHIAFFSFVLVLPVGYYADNPDSTNAAIGVHGGIGQVATVLRNCDGDVLEAEANRFRDISGSAYINVNPKDKIKIIVGMRAGSWVSDMDYSERSDPYDDSVYNKDFSFSYINPNISIEARNFGVGLGFFSEPLPINLPEFGGNYDNDLRASGHLRLGTLEKGYFAFSYGESVAIMSGGGYFDVGIGYPITDIGGVTLFSGLTGGWFDNAGFLQQAKIRLDKHIDLDISLRIGMADKYTEYAISGGFVYRFNLASKK